MLWNCYLTNSVVTKKKIPLLYKWKKNVVAIMYIRKNSSKHLLKYKKIKEKKWISGIYLLSISCESLRYMFKKFQQKKFFSSQERKFHQDYARNLLQIMISIII